MMSIAKILTISALSIFFLQCKKDVTNPNDSNTCKVNSLADAEALQFFPTDNLINKDISKETIDPNSAAIIANIGSSVNLHPDFGSGTWQGLPIGIPFNVVCGNQTKVAITYSANSYDGNYGAESDPGPMPIPADAKIEGNGTMNNDKHVLVVDKENKKLYELYNATKNADNSWRASSGSVFDLTSNAYRPDGWTSADAAGMAILPLLVRYDEVAKGEIDHAIRFTLANKKVFNGYVRPANHRTYSGTEANNCLPMGGRMRLKASFDISGFSKTNQVILNAMKKYGIILADNGSSMFISGAPDERWDNEDLAKLKTIKAADFEVITLGQIYK